MTWEWALILGTGIQAYSSYQAGVDARQQARQQAAYAEYNAKVAQRQADYERQAAQSEATQHRRKSQIIMAQMRASVTDVAMSGSPLLVMEDTANQLNLERANILAAGENRYAAYRNQSFLDKARAKAYKKQGSNAYTSGLFGAAEAGIGGYATYKFNKSLLV